MSSTANPYQQFLGDRNPQEVISATPERLRQLFLAAGTAERSYAPGKWTGRQIMCHLADCEIAFSFRLRQAAAEENHVIQPFDQDAWSLGYDLADTGQALDVFCTLRGWNIAFLKALPETIMTKTVKHPERGEMTFGTIVQTMAGHDGNHLAQLETIARQD